MFVDYEIGCTRTSKDTLSPATHLWCSVYMSGAARIALRRRRSRVEAEQLEFEQRGLGRRAFSWQHGLSYAYHHRSLLSLPLPGGQV
jgi:hypothetical protein